MSKIDNLLSRLGKVQKTGKDSWKCRCPAHQDKSPSLTIKEDMDGKILINCFAGCGALEVLGAIGMDYSDLFPDTLETSKPSRLRISITEAARILEHEAAIIFHYGNAYQLGETPDNTRLIKAVWNINRVKELVGVN
jgi:hypothetical protein